MINYIFAYGFLISVFYFIVWFVLSGIKEHKAIMETRTLISEIKALIQNLQKNTGRE